MGFFIWEYPGGACIFLTGDFDTLRFETFKFKPEILLEITMKGGDEKGIRSRNGGQNILRNGINKFQQIISLNVLLLFRQN